MRQNITEMQMIQCNLTAGNFTVSFYNAEFLVSYDLTATDLQSKFHDAGFGKISANSVGTSDDICGGSITLITFGNMGDVPLIQITDSNLVSSSTVREGVAAKVNEVQKVVAKVSANPEIQIVHFTSPTFKLSFKGQTSFSLDKNTTEYFARLQSISSRSCSVFIYWAENRAVLP